MPKISKNARELLKSITENLGKSIAETNTSLREQHEEHLKCPISMELFEDPVFCPGDGHTYERVYIERHFENSSKSPLSGIELTPEQKTLVPNFAVKSACDALRKGEQPQGRSCEIPPLRPNRVSNDEEIHRQLQILGETMTALDQAERSIYIDLEDFWTAFQEFFNDPADITILFPRLEQFKSTMMERPCRCELFEDLSWIMQFSTPPNKECVECRNHFEYEEEGFPQEYRVPDSRDEDKTYVWKLWFCCEACEEAFKAQLEEEHPIISGSVDGMNVRWDPIHTETEFRRINLGI